MFISYNEAEHFSYEDCVIREFKIENDSICVTAEALIVEPDNSQNSNYTRSYADTATISFEGARVINAVKEGFRRYDADDRLLEEIPDRTLDGDETKNLLSGLCDQYLYDLIQAGINGEERNYVLGIEMVTDDITGADADSYQILIQCTGMTVSWERYLNRTFM